MSIEYDRLAYMNLNHTQSWISDQTGIPQSTLSYVLSGQRELPTKYNGYVLETYMRTTATNLSTAGLPLHQIPRFSSNIPSRVLEVTKYVTETASKLATGYLLKKADEDDIPNTQLDQYIADNYDEAVNSITLSLRKSEKPIEEWTDYPTKYSDYFDM